MAIPSALKVETRQTGAVTVVVWRGKITLGDASQSVRTLVEKLVSEGQPRIVFNLAAVPFVDSAGLGALTMSFTKTKNAGGLLKLAEVQPRVTDALEMTRLTRLFPLYATENEAVESFGEMPKG